MNKTQKEARVDQTIIDLKTISFLKEDKQTPSVESMLMCPAKSHNRTYYDFLAQRYSKIQDRPLVTERRHNKRIVDKR